MLRGRSRLRRRWGWAAAGTPDPEAGCRVHEVGVPSAGHDWPWWQIELTHTEGTQKGSAN